MARLLEDIGFDGVQVRERFDPFEGTSKEKVARKYRVAGVNVRCAAAKCVYLRPSGVL